MAAHLQAANMVQLSLLPKPISIGCNFSQVASPPEKTRKKKYEGKPVLQAEEMVQPPLLPKPSAQDPTAQSIVVDNASFAWEASAQPMLSNISLTARCP